MACSVLAGGIILHLAVRYAGSCDRSVRSAIQALVLLGSFHGALSWIHSLVRSAITRRQESALWWPWVRVHDVRALSDEWPDVPGCKASQAGATL